MVVVLEGSPDLEVGPVLAGGMAIGLVGARFEAVAAGDLFQAHMAYRSPWITIEHSFAKGPF